MSPPPKLLAAYGVLACVVALGLVLGVLCAYWLAQPALRLHQNTQAHIVTDSPRAGAILLQKMGEERARQDGLATLESVPMASKGHIVRAQIRVEGSNADVLTYIGHVETASDQFELERLAISRAVQDGARVQADLLVSARWRAPPKGAGR